jgi:hypothetical protein
MIFKGTVESDFMKVVKDFQINKSTLIDYAGADFDSIRLNLVKYIQAVYPLDYNNFVESDLGVMLIDLMAYVGTVTSMKADFLANENFLRTARNRNSVKKLLELIGVRLKGPTSAVASAVITLDARIAKSETFDIPADNRVVTISSPEDGEQLSYTLYKTQNGMVDFSNSDGSITLTYDDSINGLTFNKLVLIEGALIRKEGNFGAGNGVKFISLDISPVVEGSIEVLVANERYTEVENLYYVSGGDSKVFQVISDDDYKATLVFGDNILSRSPSPGDAFVITYRAGGGTRGNLPKSFINVPMQGEVGSVPRAGTLESVSQATGGGNAETIAHAKRYAPLAFRRQDRLVTMLDYQSFSNSFISNYGSAGKAIAATRRAFSSANIIDIYILEKANDLQLKKASPSFKKQLIDAIEPKKMLTDDVVVVDGLIRTLDIVTTLRISKELKENEEVIKQNVASIITSYFNVDNRDFGQEFVPQDLAREIFSLPSVIFATIDNYEGAIKVDFNEFIQLNNFTINIVRV